MSLKARQNTPALGAAFYYPIDTLYQLQPSFHRQSTEPEPTARARRAGEEFYQTTLAFMFVSFRLLVVEAILAAWSRASPIRGSVKAARFEDFVPPRLGKNKIITQTREYQRRHYPDGP